jgi:hypothetical protein
VVDQSILDCLSAALAACKRPARVDADFTSGNALMSQFSRRAATI